MTKQDLVNALVEKTGCSKAAAAATLDATFTAITEALGRGEKLTYPGFGTFSVSDRAARQGRNPATGETIEIAASKAVKFKAASGLKATLSK